MNNNELRITFSKEHKITAENILSSINPAGFDAEILSATFEDYVLHLTFKDDLKYFSGHDYLNQFFSERSYEFPESIEYIDCLSCMSKVVGKTASEDGSMVIAQGRLVYVYENSFKDAFAIPEGVTYISKNVFLGYNELKKVTLPDSLEEIGDYAFKNSGITSIKISKKLSRIGAHAFEGSSLGTLKITDNVTSIGDQAFRDCSKLKKVTIGKNVEHIGHGAFARCTKLAEFNGKYATDNKQFLVKDGVLLAVADAIEELVLPENIIEIAPYAFCCSNSGVVVLPSELRVIGDHAFEYSHRTLRNIFPEHLESIGECAFMHFDLPRLILPDSLKILGEGAFAFNESITIFAGKYATDDGKYLIKDGILIGAAREATGSDIPKEVRVIGKYAFASKQKNRTRIDIPEGVTDIHEGAFMNSRITEGFSFPSTLKTIGDRAFEKTNVHDNADLIFQEGLVSVGDYCFHLVDLGSHDYHPSIKFPSSLRKIGHYCFNEACYYQRLYIEINSLEVPEGINGHPYMYHTPTILRVPLAAKDAYISALEKLNLWQDRWTENENNIKLDFIE